MLALRKSAYASVLNGTWGVSLDPVLSRRLVGEASILDGMVLILIVLLSRFGTYGFRTDLTIRVVSALDVFSAEWPIVTQ